MLPTMIIAVMDVRKLASMGMMSSLVTGLRHWQPDSSVYMCVWKLEGDSGLLHFW